VLGQFNLGFILARLDRDLIIVDQHASGATEWADTGLWMWHRQRMAC